MDAATAKPHLVVLGAGVIGLTTAVTLRAAYPSAHITIVAKHFPGDRSIEYASPWAGANWSSIANDNGALEHYDRLTFQRFAKMVDEDGIGEEVGIGRLPMQGIFDGRIEEVGILSAGTGKIWYEELVKLRKLRADELPKGGVFGLYFGSTFRINTQVYLNWYVEARFVE